MIVDGHEMTASHSEADIYNGCIALMQELMERFEEYLDWLGIHPDNDEDVFWTDFYPTHIVERLFLWHTTHSGGTSQHLKCHELGIDTNSTVSFVDKRGAQEDE